MAEDLTKDRVRCMMQSAVNAEWNVKYHSSQQKENQSTVGNVSKREDPDASRRTPTLDSVFNFFLKQDGRF